MNASMRYATPKATFDLMYGLNNRPHVQHYRLYSLHRLHDERHDIRQEEHIVGTAPEMSSEDFPEFGREVPYFFYWLGSGFPGRENAGWHSPKFRTDDDALALDAALLARSALLGLTWEG